MIKRLCLLMALICPVQLYATTYYVNKSGNNGNSCTTAQSATDANAKLTIAAGMACLAAGDTLEIGAGTYTEGISPNSPNAQPPSGVSDAVHTIVKGEAGQTIIINGKDTSNNICLMVYNRAYLTFQNLVFDGVSETTNGGVWIGGSAGIYSHHILVQDSTVRNFKTPGTGAVSGNGGPTGTHDLTFTNLTVHNNGTTETSTTSGHGIYVSAQNVTVQDCTIYLNHAEGIQVYLGGSNAVTGTILRRNKVYSNNSLGITLGSGSNQVAYNNIVYGNGVTVAGSGGVRTYSYCTGCAFYSNTIYNNTGTGMLINSGATSSVVRNNLIIGNSTTNTITDGGNLATKSNNITSGLAATYFTNAGSSDFTLVAGNNAIETGYTLGSPYTTDYASVTRANGSTTGSLYDIGAYEYGSPPASITVLTPNGGESWEIGTTQSITWTSVGAGSTIEITADLDGNGTYETTIDASDPNDGTYSWTVAGSANANCKVKVKDTAAATNDVSDAVFALTGSTVTPTITLVTPVASAVYAKDSNVTISWTSTNVTGNVLVELSRNGGTTYSTIGTYAYDASDVVYVATTPSSSDCKIRITSVNNGVATATSGAFRLGGRIM